MEINSNVKIEWVNHASFVVRYKDFSLISDPWIFGSVFNNGWDLLSLSKFTVEDFANVKYIWFSHEHPDHFFPPVLKSIPNEIRENITVLFQETKDKRVVKFCKSLNFKILELEHQKEYTLDEDVKFSCIPNGVEDSLCLIKVGGKNILNLNDCVFFGEKDLKKLNIKDNIDVLLSIFGYAYRISNPDDKSKRIKAANELLEAFKAQVIFFEPEYVIPFAAYKYFSHVNNFYLNAENNSPQMVFDYLKQNCPENKINILYPGDVWKIGDIHDNELSLNKYSIDWQNKKPIHNLKELVEIEVLINMGKSLIFKIRNKHNNFFIDLFSLSPLSYSLAPLKIYVKDLNKYFILSIKGKIKVLEKCKEFDLEIDSNSLLFCLSNDFGFSSMINNGAYLTFNKGEGKLFCWAHIGLMTNSNERLGLEYLFSNLEKIKDYIVN